MKYYQRGEIRNVQFYMTPKSLFDKKYQLSPLAKLCYAVLLDRLELSLKNDWVDDKGVYIIFTREEMAELQGVHVNTVVKAFKELSEAELIEEGKQGFGKPYLIYVGHVDTQGVRSDTIITDIVTDNHNISGRLSQDMYSSNTNINNNNSNDKLSKERCEAQTSLFSMPEKKVEKHTSQFGLALWKINEAREGRLPWSDVTHRDFTYFYIDVHNKKMPKPVTFDRYTSVGIIRDRLLKPYEISNEKACEYIQAIIDDYSTHPDKWDSLTFNMIDKQTKLIDDIMKRVKRKLDPVELTYNWNDLGEIKDDGTRVF